MPSVLVGRTFRQQLIRLEKQTSTQYNNPVHEISDYNNRSLGAGGVRRQIKGFYYLPKKVSVFLLRQTSSCSVDLMMHWPTLRLH